MRRIFLVSPLLILGVSCGDTIPLTVDASDRQATSLAGTNQAYIYPDNPSVMEGKFKTSANYSGELVARNITDNVYLETQCDFTQYFVDSFDTSDYVSYTDTTTNNCMQVYENNAASTEILQSTNESWVFDTYSTEFYQVNNFYHTDLIMKRFLNSLSFAHKQVHLEGELTLPPATKYNFIDTASFWLSEEGSLVTLKSYTDCYEGLNASFSPTTNSLCYGYYDDGNFRMVQDPTIIYHEVGHAFVKIMMNQRNITSGYDPDTSSVVFESHPYESDLGELFYDEAGSINEAIADYFSYYINGRTRVGEYALNYLSYNYKKEALEDYGVTVSTNVYGQYRPLSEDEDAHTAPVSTASGERLAYPTYLYYDYANTDEIVEGVHYASSIASHYLVALSEELKSQCTFSSTDEDVIHETVGNYMVLLLSETLGEIGDLTAKGSDIFSPYAMNDSDLKDVFFVNLNEDESFRWTQAVNPPNYRKFFRIFGKNILHHISSDLCPNFSVDESEQLLDEYGLLLFKSYEDRGNGINIGDFSSEIYAAYTGDSLFTARYFSPVIYNTAVNEDNRKISLLIRKDYIDLDDDIVAYVIDDQSGIASILANLTFEGENVQPTDGIAGTIYNNSNAKLSPGEVVAVSLNLFNDSNSTMGGVQFLANDWDHMKLSNNSNTFINRNLNKTALDSGDISGGLANFEPCIIDSFPSATNGGVTDTDSSVEGNCSYISRTNAAIDTSTVVDDVTYPQFEPDAPQPICLVQYSDDNETKWVSQGYFRKVQLGLEDSACLNNPSKSGVDFNPNECLIRVLPGADQAILGKIDAQKTWFDTITSNDPEEFEFASSEVVLMEINKNIQPGTKFNCRFRVRFTNCDDCYEEDDDAESEFPDYKYSGSEPFKVINFQFTVVD